MDLRLPRCTDRVYPVPITKGEQVTTGNLAADQDMQGGSASQALRLLLRTSLDQGSVRIISIQHLLRECLTAAQRYAKERPNEKV
jgi:hypothetical protein